MRLADLEALLGGLVPGTRTAHREGRRSICIIGAGPCGLVTCKVLVHAGYDVEVLDAAPAIGGMWNLETPRSAAYLSLRAKTSKKAMAFSDFPMPASFPDFPDREQVLEYLNLYADHFALRPHIVPNCNVERVDRVDGRWAVWLDNGREYPRRYDALVVCTGQFREPVLPRLPGADMFRGIQLHSRDYLSPTAPHPLGGKRVVVVGLGVSALDIAGELADAGGAQVELSVRSGRFLAPNMVDGRPVDSASMHPSHPLPMAARLLPRWLAISASHLAFRKFWRNVQAYYGTAEQLGFPEPSYQPWEKPPTITADIRPVLMRGSIRVRPDIERLEGRQVRFVDGSTLEADAIVYGTGYRWTFPFLKDMLAAVGDDSEAGEDLVLDHRIAHPRLGGLFFIGFCKQLCSILPLAEQQALWLAAHLSGVHCQAVRPTPLSQPFGTICNFYVDDLRRDIRRKVRQSAVGRGAVS